VSKAEHELLKDAKGNVRVTVVIGGDCARVRFWDVGFKGSEDAPILLAEQGWTNDGDGRSYATVTEEEFAERLTAGRYECVDDAEMDGDPLSSAAVELLDAMSTAMQRLGEM